jgi:hypothetical protein
MSNDSPTLLRVGKVYPVKGSKNLSKTIVGGKPTVFSTGYLKEGDCAIHIPPGWSVNARATIGEYSPSVRNACLDGWLPRDIGVRKFFGCKSYGVLVAVVPEKIYQAEERLHGKRSVPHVSSSVTKTNPATLPTVSATRYVLKKMYPQGEMPSFMNYMFPMPTERQKEVALARALHAAYMAGTKQDLEALAVASLMLSKATK